jgi:hypothetical protein
MKGKYLKLVLPGLGGGSRVKEIFSENLYDTIIPISFKLPRRKIFHPKLGDIWKGYCRFVPLVRQLLTRGKSQYRRASKNGERSKRTILAIYRRSFDVDFLREYLSSAWRLFERWSDRLCGDRVSCRTFWGENCQDLSGGFQSCVRIRVCP